jgi:hypothetical protein
MRVGVHDTQRRGWTALPEPRQLTPAEQALLDRLVAHARCAELTAQAAAAVVTEGCECGCGSIRLYSDAPAISPEKMRQFSCTGRDDWFSIAGRATVAGSPDVVLHIVQGSLHELEIFAGQGVKVEPPPPDEVNDITLM